MIMVASVFIMYKCKTVNELSNITKCLSGRCCHKSYIANKVLLSFDLHVKRKIVGKRHIGIRL